MRVDVAQGFSPADPAALKGCATFLRPTIVSCISWLKWSVPIVLSTAVSCSRPAPPPPTARHLVFVSIDTLRADRVGIYSGVDLTPTLDRIAKAGAYAVDATSHVPLTRPAHATMLSGLWPWQAGIRDNLSAGVLPSSPLLAEILKGAGFRTAAFVSSIVLGARGGFSRGFDRYDDSFPEAAGVSLDTLQKPGAETLREALTWLEGERGADRICLFLHLYEPHDPYEPPEPYASRYRDRPYDGEVAYTDALVSQLDEAIERLGLQNDTLVVVTSDHGEGLGEHEETLHGFFVYQTTLAVPLIFRGPGIAPGGKIEGTVGHVDLLPTMLDLLGVAAPQTLRPAGVSLAAGLRGGAPPPPRPMYAESLVPLLHFGWSDLRVIRDERWKFVLAPRPELYDLATDPREQHNLAAAQSSRASALRGALAKLLDQERRESSGARAASVPVDLLERLGALGYVGGSSPATTATPGADPKDKIADFRRANDLMREGILALNRKDYAGSARRFEELIASGIESFEGHLYLARALMGQRRPDRAAVHFEQAARRAPALEDAWTGWAGARRASAGPAAALAVVREGRGHNPKSSRLWLLEAELCLRLRKPREAIAAYEAALPLAPKDGVLRQRLGELLRDSGQVDAAIERLRESVAVDPASAAAWNALGMTLGGNNRLSEAEQAFREAMTRDATNHHYVFNLGLALQRQGRAAESRPYFEKSLQLSPGFAPAREELRKLGVDR
jgi:arylsulfatase A-like enzyme/Tfp pilus assembly protein PilF